jgi:hypothetical protein
MGYRTVVVLFNDQCSEWENDPELGKKIAAGMNFCGDRLGRFDRSFNPADLRYGRVVQCVHADTQTVSILDGYDMDTVLHSFWRPGEKEDEKAVRLMKEFAEKHGYRLVKKPEPKSS